MYFGCAQKSSFSDCLFLWDIFKAMHVGLRKESEMPYKAKSGECGLQSLQPPSALQMLARKIAQVL